jgi:hypothetical protein
MVSGISMGWSKSGRMRRLLSQASWISCWTFSEAIEAGEHSTTKAVQPRTPRTISALQLASPAMLRRSIQTAVWCCSSRSAMPSARSRSAEA